MPDETITIPARRGKAAFVERGHAVKVINTHGSQVVDTFAFVRNDIRELMSMEHSRPYFMHLRPRVGDVLVTNKRRPVLTLEEDTSPGQHDTLIAACDRYRYELLGVEGYHDNCTDNLAEAMGELGLEVPETPAPLNLFMNIPWSADGTLEWGEPDTKPGDYVVLRAELDIVIAFSACPQDIVPVNGALLRPTEAHFQVI